MFRARWSTSTLEASSDRGRGGHRASARRTGRGCAGWRADPDGCAGAALPANGRDARRVGVPLPDDGRRAEALRPNVLQGCEAAFVLRALTSTAYLEPASVGKRTYGTPPP